MLKKTLKLFIITKSREKRYTKKIIRKKRGTFMRLSELQMHQVNERIDALVSAGSFYGKKLEEAGIKCVNSQEEFEKLPFSKIC